MAHTPAVSDPSTLSNYTDVVVKDIFLDLTVDFATKRLHGDAVLRAEVVTDGTDVLVLDSKAINIVQVFVNDAKVEFTLGETVGALGNALTIPLPEDSRAAGTELSVRVSYATSSGSSALQWLGPEQTHGKEHPYLFTQCQAIHARTMLPCQDAPGVKVTYSARIVTPKPLTALMSALRRGQEAVGDDGVAFSFEQPVPMPSYLIALAVGRLESRELSERSTVWAEPGQVDAAAEEFSETESFLKTGEDLLGPYVWGRYDLLCLPPSFPYGGMENPCLTFVTPTLLAGDKSLADVVCHEIAHSWTGNLVTNATWEHFWLNEGFTMFVQRKIIGRLQGEEVAEFDMEGGWKTMKDSVDLFGHDHPFTALIPDLSGNADPDDAFSSVPYEKGFNFLYYLQSLVGKEAFEKFLYEYIQHFKFKTLTSDDFKNFYLEHFADKDLSEIDWETWLTKPGMPPVRNKYDTTISDTVFALGDKWLAGGEGTSADDIASWPAPQTIGLLDYLLLKTEDKPLSPPVLSKMDSFYNFTDSGNSEIRFRWQLMNIAAGVESIVPHVEAFLGSQGRMKYVRPLYRALYASVFGKERARAIFRKLADSYHPIARKLVTSDLGMAGASEGGAAAAAADDGEEGKAAEESAAVEVIAEEKPKKKNNRRRKGLLVFGALAAAAGYLAFSSKSRR
eukprot:PLAT12798.1.p2 GENE.PLAT12798.1~~PLAT12798.1.p2  ORF type:complete len:689 (+),score=370.56 PLAT12798.1:38-2068(+)